MRRTLIVIFLVLISLLNANFLIDVYHKDYGVIDRTVLVFDTKPDYEILKHESDLQINLPGCRKDASLQEISINNSKVITGFDYVISEEKVMVMININTSQLLVTGEIYKVEGMELQGNVFKLVLDIFIATEPQTLSELTSYASFYEKTGEVKLAEEYKNKVLGIHNELKNQQETTDTKSMQATAKKESVNVTEKIKSVVQNISSKLDLKIVGFAIGVLILLIIVIFLIVKLLRKKTSAFDMDDDSIRPTDGFADSAYLEKVAKKLSAKNWEIEEIAKELDLPLEKVQRIIAPDLEQELEHL